MKFSNHFESDVSEPCREAIGTGSLGHAYVASWDFGGEGFEFEGSDVTEMYSYDQEITRITLMNFIADGDFSTSGCARIDAWRLESFTDNRRKCKNCVFAGNRQ